MQEVNSYKDYNGKTVKVGDHIEKFGLWGEEPKDMGTVTKILKTGFYVHPQTDKTKYQFELWGKFTRKVEKVNP